MLKASFFLACLKLNAQTLTCQYNCPHVGEVFSIKTSSPVVHTGGLNQVWDFRQVQAVSSNATMISYIDPASVPASSLYPQATIAKQEGGNYSFLETGNNGIKSLTPPGVTVSAQSIGLPLPFSYGSTYSETIVTKYLSGTDTIWLTTSKSISGVGTGTLMLPGGTYTDVLRISGQTIQSYTTNGLSDGVVYTTLVNYYYSEKISLPLLSSVIMSSNGPGDFAPLTQFMSAVLTGIKQETNEGVSGIMITPNPASDVVHISTLSNNTVEITLSNSFGEVVFRQSLFAQSVEFNLSQFPGGLYTVTIRGGENFQSKKLLVIH